MVLVLVLVLGLALGLVLGLVLGLGLGIGLGPGLGLGLVVFRLLSGLEILNEHVSRTQSYTAWMKPCQLHAGSSVTTGPGAHLVLKNLSVLSRFVCWRLLQQPDKPDKPNWWHNRLPQQGSNSNQAYKHQPHGLATAPVGCVF